MAKFKVKIIREFEFDIEASSPDEARELACDESWNENDSFFEMKVEDEEGNIH